jgi:hypothetical protein
MHLMHLMHFMYLMQLWISVFQEEFVEFSLIKGKYVSTYAHNKLNFKVRPYRVETLGIFQAAALRGAASDGHCI